ncbi:MAG TPA: RND transporter [Janthinobacterium sp.]|nr:RND transporter [Janthinobacterium sp.]
MRALLNGSLLGAALLTGCGTIPAKAPPELSVPAAFKEAAPPAAAAAPVQPDGRWWQVFHSLELDSLIAEATQANASLAVAAARVRQARAVAGIADADRSVQVGAQAGVQRGVTPPGLAATNWQAGLTASYELDLFRRIGAASKAAEADAQAQQASYGALMLVLQADVAQTWFRLRATDAELRSLERTAQLWEEHVSVTQRRYELGDIGEFDLVRARTELAGARADAIGLQNQRAQFEHGLAVLLGRPAASFGAPARPLEADLVLPRIPAGLPSSLLERRPDIGAAQRALEAAQARIGVARSSLLPSLTLGGGGAGVGGTVGELFGGAGRSWLFDAVLAMPLFDGGRRQAGIARSEAVYDEAAATWRLQVLQAFAEVEDNVAGLRILARQSAQVDSALQSAQRAADLAQQLYRGGRSSYLDLLDARRNLARVERNAVQLRGSRAVATVALIRALGGGWDAS